MPDLDGYGVQFGPDVEGDIAADRYEVVEITNAPSPDHNPPSPRSPSRIFFDGTRLVLPLGPEHTSDGTYSTTEVASSRRFEQQPLDEAARRGSPRVVVPGRQAVWRDIVFAPEFADQRAAAQHVTAGCCAQSWTGIENGANDPAFIGLSLFYTGRRGDEPADHVDEPKPFVALVGDQSTGLGWARPVPTFDPTVPHDVVIRWHHHGDVEFLVDGRTVATFESARARKPLTAQPCHVDCWLNNAASAGTDVVNNGYRLAAPLWVAIGGLAIEPLD